MQHLRFAIIPAIVLVLIASLGASSLDEQMPPDPDGPIEAAPGREVRPPAADPVPYPEAVRAAEAMAWDPVAQALASLYGMDLLNVTWEDTGRYQNSAVGPNISDMTIQVQLKNPQRRDYSLHLMPVLRYPNFADLTADLKPEDFRLLVGNEDGEPLRDISLRDFLETPGDYLSDPGSWKGGPDSLLAPRDSHVLVSAQACFLPIPSQGEALFNPVLFNYQSSPGNPAVLTVLATREGSSVTIIDNARDGFDAGGSWGQRLFFNDAGQRASLTGTRLSDWDAADDGQSGPDAPAGPGAPAGPTAAGDTGLNMVLLIQIPLKHESFLDDMVYAESGAEPMMMEAERSTIEEAVIGHGPVEGPFTEIDGQDIVRDPDFPVRVTVQFYMATDNGVVTDADMLMLARRIERVYADADYVGSLVVQDSGNRPTAYTGSKIEPPGWWEAFWAKHLRDTGLTREETIRILTDLYGPDWLIPRGQDDLQAAVDEARASGGW